jgi:hypothetical protein
LATRLAPRFGLDRYIKAGLWVTVIGSVAILLMWIFSPVLLLVSRRHGGVPARHGHRQSLRNGAGAVSVRRKGRYGFRADGFLADDDGGDRGLASGKYFASGDVRARHRTDGGLPGGARTGYYFVDCVQR